MPQETKERAVKPLEFSDLHSCGVDDDVARQVAEEFARYLEMRESVRRSFKAQRRSAVLRDLGGSRS